MKFFSCFVFQIILIGLFLTTASRSQWIQQDNKLIPTNNIGTAIFFGYSVALSADGNTAVVGGIGDNTNAGAAWIYTRNGSGTWSVQAKLFGTGATGSASQGFSVAISADGNTVVVSGIGDNTNKGAIWVFIRSGTVWTPQGSKLVGTGAVGNAEQGFAVSLSADGNTIAVAGWRDNTGAGAVWIFKRNGIVWSQQGNKLTVSDAILVARFGSSIDLSADGNTLIIGGHYDNTFAGAAWVFIRNGNSWTSQTKLTGADAIGIAPRFGRSVSISSDGNTAVVGGYDDDGSKGAVWVYTRSGSTWTQQGNKLIGTGATGNAKLGFSISLSDDGNTVVVGGYTDNANAGAAWIFTRNGSVWSQSGNKLVGSGAIGSAVNQGGAVAISPDGNTVIVGGIGDDTNKGAAWVFIPGTTSVENISSEIPKEFMLEQNYPNPFNPSTNIQFALPQSGFVKLEIFSLTGERVDVLISEELSAGKYNYEWNGSNLTSGIYFYRLNTGSFIETRKMLLIK